MATATALPQQRTPLPSTTHTQHTQPVCIYNRDRAGGFTHTGAPNPQR